MIERFDVDASNDNPAYQAFAADHRDRYSRAAQWIVTQFHWRKTPEIVDAASGCGYGYDALNNVGNYVGLDVSPDAVTAARQRRPYGKFLVADLCDPLSFSGLHPDVVVSFETAEHLSDPEAFLRTVHRVLPEDGLFLFSAPTCLTRDFDPYHKWDWSATRWERAIRRAGFKICRIESTPFEEKFSDLFRMIPLSKWQLLRGGGFLLLHPRYLFDRCVNWGYRNRFSWQSTMFFCEVQRFSTNGRTFL